MPSPTVFLEEGTTHCFVCLSRDATMVRRCGNCTLCFAHEQCWKEYVTAQRRNVLTQIQGVRCPTCRTTVVPLQNTHTSPCRKLLMQVMLGNLLAVGFLAVIYLLLLVAAIVAASMREKIYHDLVIAMSLVMYGVMGCIVLSLGTFTLFYCSG